MINLFFPIDISRLLGFPTSTLPDWHVHLNRNIHIQYHWPTIHIQYHRRRPSTIKLLAPVTVDISVSMGSSELNWNHLQWTSTNQQLESTTPNYRRRPNTIKLLAPVTVDISVSTGSSELSWNHQQWKSTNQQLESTTPNHRREKLNSNSIYYTLLHRVIHYQRQTMGPPSPTNKSTKQQMDISRT